MNVYKEYSQSLKLEFVKVEDAADKVLAALDAGDYKEAKAWTEAIKLHCSFFSAQAKYRAQQDAKDAHD